MATDSSNNQELALKKRARRRLVGAIALVLFMVIVLPRVLQDRAAIAPQEAIKITMSEDNAKQQNAPVDTKITSTKETVVAEVKDELKSTDVPEISENSIKDIAEKPVAKAEETNAKTTKPIESKSIDVKSQTGNVGSFSIQVGVFSDIDNVKQLQAKLKQAGLTSRTETINTEKGKKIRLKAGSFSSRQEAAYALTKLQEVDLSGMVISNN